MNYFLGLIIVVLTIIHCHGSIAPIFTGSAVHPALVRTPLYNSALVQSNRFGGNFVYSISESHALQPILRSVGPVVDYQWNGIPVSYTPQVYWISSVPVGVPGVQIPGVQIPASLIPGSQIPGVAAGPGVVPIDPDAETINPNREPLEPLENNNTGSTINNSDNDSVTIESAK